MTGNGRGPGGPPQRAAFAVVSLDARPELTVPALELPALGWPEFMQHDPVAERHQARLATELAGFQALLLDDKDELAALGVVPAFAALAREHDALLYVDDAHGFGIVGEQDGYDPTPYGRRGNAIIRWFGEHHEQIVLTAGFSKAYSSRWPT